MSDLIVKMPPRENKRMAMRYSFLTWAASGVLVLATLVALIGPALVPDSLSAIAPADNFKPPVFFGGSWQHPLGTDQLGRDVLARLVDGTRVSMTVALAAVGIAGTVGAVLGIIAGYRGGWLDTVLMRVADAQLALPFIILGLAVVAAVGASLTTIVLIVAASSWVQYTRVVRSETLVIRQSDFVAMAELAGLKHVKVMVRHIVPNVLPSVIVLGTLDFGKAMIYEATLSFLGLGIQPPASSWGLMISDGRVYLDVAPYLVIVPGFVLAITALSTNIAGDAVRDLMDPSLKEID